MKPFVEGNLIEAEMVKFLCDRFENIPVKGENAGYQHFLLDLKAFADETLVVARVIGIKTIINEALIESWLDWCCKQSFIPLSHIGTGKVFTES